MKVQEIIDLMQQNADSLDRLSNYPLNDKLLFNDESVPDSDVYYQIYYHTHFVRYDELLTWLDYNKPGLVNTLERENSRIMDSAKALDKNYQEIKWVFSKQLPNIVKAYDPSLKPREIRKGIKDDHSFRIALFKTGVSIFAEKFRNIAKQLETEFISGSLEESAETEQSLMGLLIKIANIVHKDVQNELIKHCFQKHLISFRMARSKFGQALKKAQEAAMADPKLRYDYDDVRDKGKEPPKPPRKDYELEDHYVLDEPPKGFWRPPLPFNPDGYLQRFQCKLFGLFTREEEPRNRNQMLMCEFALIAAIHDEALDIPACDRLTDRDKDDWVESLWKDVSHGGVTWDDLLTYGDRMRNINTAFNDMEADLAKQSAETKLEIETQEEDRQSETDDIAIDDKELTIIVELSEGSDKTYSQVEIEAATNIPRGTIKDKLLRLETIELVHRPLGKRKGYQITDKGREIVKRNE